MEAHDRLYAFSEHVEREILVGRVDGIAFEAEPHQYGFHAEHLFKSGNDGYATAASYGQGSFAECLLEAFLCGTIGRVRDGADVALAAMQAVDAVIGGHAVFDAVQGKAGAADAVAHGPHRRALIVGEGHIALHGIKAQQDIAGFVVFVLQHDGLQRGPQR